MIQHYKTKWYSNDTGLRSMLIVRNTYFSAKTCCKYLPTLACLGVEYE